MESLDKSAEQCSDPLVIAIVVGESSGDLLGAGLIIELKKIYPNARFEGIGGPKMIAEGFHSLFPQDRLAVMGLVEPLARLPELLSIRGRLRKHFIQIQPAVFIGIDAPDFNLDLELSLKIKSIPTVHYVSPSVWAWRQGRIKKITKAVDLMLTLLPFEAEFYVKHNVPVKFVGHPLADQLPITPNQKQAIEQLGIERLASSKKIIALLPGSRAGEIQRMGKLFLDVAEHCFAQRQDLIFLIPSANEKRLQQIKELLAGLDSQLPIKIFEGQSHLVMESADVVIMASGTTTLEAMLLKRPMVIAYKLASISYWLLSRLVKVKYIGLPNLLSDKALVPEFIQDDATVSNIGNAALEFLVNGKKALSLQNSFTIQHLQLKQNASARAAKSIADLISRKEQNKP